MIEPLSGVVVALPDAPFDDLIGAIEVMVQQGLRTFAFHAETAGLDTWVGIYGARARIGVHRVSTGEGAREAVASGASFVLADIASEDLADPDVPAAIYLPALTPSEIRDVLKLPVAGVQVTPVSALGSDYPDELAALGLTERCLPRGGLGVYGCSRWFSAGASAVVVDEELLGDSLAGGDLESLRYRCEGFAAARD